MATVTTRGLIDQLIAHDGYYSDDPRVAEIVEFENTIGATVWGVTWMTEPRSRQQRYRVETEFVRKPRVIWSSSQNAPVAS